MDKSDIYPVFNKRIVFPSIMAGLSLMLLMLIIFCWPKYLVAIAVPLTGIVVSLIMFGIHLVKQLISRKKCLAFFKYSNGNSYVIVSVDDDIEMKSLTRLNISLFPVDTISKVIHDLSEYLETDLYSIQAPRIFNVRIVKKGKFSEEGCGPQGRQMGKYAYIEESGHRYLLNLTRHEFGHFLLSLRNTPSSIHDQILVQAGKDW